MADHLSSEHYAQVVALLLASGIQARRVSGQNWEGVDVRQDTDRILWTNVEATPEGDVVSLPWGWTVVDKVTGKIGAGRTHIAPDASPEDVALCILTMYSPPEDGPAL